MQVVVKFPPAQPGDLFSNESRILPTSSAPTLSAARDPSTTSMSIPHIFNAEAVDFRPAQACVQKTMALKYNPMAAVFQPRARSFILNSEASRFLPQRKLDPEAATFLPQSPPTQSTGQQEREKVARQKVTLSFPEAAATISKHNDAEINIVQEKLNEVSKSIDCQDTEADPEPWLSITSDSGTLVSVEDLDSDTSTRASVERTNSLTSSDFKFNAEAPSFVFESNKLFTFDPDASEFVSEKQKPFAFNLQAAPFVLEQGKPLGINARTNKFIPTEKTFVFNPLALKFVYQKRKPFTFNPEAHKFVSENNNPFIVNPEACEFVSEEDLSFNFNPEACEFVFKEKEPFALNPEAVEFAFTDHAASSDKSDKTVLESYQGSRLQDQVTGSTTKAYQDFGNWWEDTYYADEDMPELDPFNPGEYKDTEVMFNGLMWNETAPSSNDIMASARATDDVLFKGAIERYNNAKERCRMGVGKSILSQTVLPEDVVEPARPSAAQLADEEARRKIRDLPSLVAWGNDVDVDDDRETMKLSTKPHDEEAPASSLKGLEVQDVQVMQSVEAVPEVSESTSSSTSDSGDTSRSPSPSPLTSEDGVDVVEDTKHEPDPTSLCKEAADQSDTAHSGDVVALSPPLVSHDNEETRITQADVVLSAEQEQDSALEATLPLRSVAAAAAEINRPSAPTKQVGLVPVPFMAPSMTEVDPYVKDLYEAILRRASPPAKAPPLYPNRLLLEWPTQPQPRSQPISPWALTRSEPGRWESNNLHALLLESEGNETNDIFYRDGAARPNTNTDTHPDDVHAGTVQPDNEQAGTVENSNVGTGIVEADTSEGNTTEAQPETPSVSSTPPPAYRSTEDLTLPPPFEAIRLYPFTHHSTASSAQLPGISLLPEEPQTSSQVFDDAPVRSPRPRHEIHTLVDLPEDKVVDNFGPEEEEQIGKKHQGRTAGGPRAILSRVGLDLAGKFGKSRKTKSVPADQTAPLAEIKDVSWASLMRKAGHKSKKPSVFKEGTTTEKDSAVEEQAQTSSWTYRAWKKCKKVVKGKQ